MKVSIYGVAAMLALLLTRVAAFLGLPIYVFLRFEKNFAALRGGLSRWVAGVIFFGPAFIAAALATAAVGVLLRRRSTVGFLVAIPLAPTLFGLFQLGAVFVFSALGIRVYNSSHQVVAAIFCGGLFGFVFSVAASWLVRVQPPPNSPLHRA